MNPLDQPQVLHQTSHFAVVPVHVLPCQKELSVGIIPKQEAAARRNVG